MSNEIDPKEMWSKFQLRSSSLAILSPPRSFQPYINSIKKVCYISQTFYLKFLFNYFSYM